MLVKYYICFPFLVLGILQIINGISNNEGKLIDAEFHRAADTPKSNDQEKTNTLKRDLLFTGQSSRYYHHPSYGLAFAPVGPDNLGHFQGLNFPHNIRPPYAAHGYGEEPPYYGHLSSGGGGLNFGHSGGGVGYYGHSGGGIGHYGHSGGGAGYYGHSGGGIGPYGHSGGGHIFPYGHGGGENYYGHEGGHGYDHDGGYGISSIGQYIKKKLSLKKIILPLAGIALIAAAAATTHPVLFQLGTLSNNVRRRRSLKKNDVFPMNPFVKPNNKRIN